MVPHRIVSAVVLPLPVLACKAASNAARVAVVLPQITNALEHVESCLQYMSLLRQPNIFKFCAIPQVRTAFCYGQGEPLFVVGGMDVLFLLAGVLCCKGGRLPAPAECGPHCRPWLAVCVSRLKHTAMHVPAMLPVPALWQAHVH